MKPANVPVLGPRYWSALVLASIFGANTGDFAAHDLHLGHALGLLPLAAIFGAILLAESRARTATEAFYWFAIVAMRTAATNIADLFDHDLHVAPPLVIAALSAALAVLVMTDRGAFARSGDGAVPATDARYWITMLVAGVLGTALGDFAADDLGFGAGPAALVNFAVLVALLGLGRAPGFGVKSLYWVRSWRSARPARTPATGWRAATASGSAWRCP